MINMQKRNYSGFQAVPDALRIKNGTAIFDFADRRNSSGIVLGTLQQPEHEPEHYGLSSREDAYFYELLPTHAFWFYWQRNRGELASAGFTVRRFQNGGMKAFLFHPVGNLTPNRLRVMKGRVPTI